LLRLLVYYELNKHDLLEYELINVERYLRQRKMWFAYEALIIKTVKKLIDPDGHEQKTVMKKFHDQLTLIGRGKTSAILPGLNEILLWALHHISGRSLQELLFEENTSTTKAEITIEKIAQSK
jgi:hypothetical protein